MSVLTEIKKYHLSGNLEGCTTIEEMYFVNEASAVEWAGTVTMKPEVSYVVLEMKIVLTGSVYKF